MEDLKIKHEQISKTFQNGFTVYFNMLNLIKDSELYTVILKSSISDYINGKLKDGTNSISNN